MATISDVAGHQAPYSAGPTPPELQQASEVANAWQTTSIADVSAAEPGEANGSSSSRQAGSQVFSAQLRILQQDRDLAGIDYQKRRRW